jgi:phasin
MATTAKTAKAPKSAATPFEAFSFPTAPSFDVPPAVRDFAEKSMTQVRDSYDRIKTAAEEATGLVEETLETSRKNAYAFGVKALDAAKTNTDASFAHARDLFGAKTVTELFELQSAFAKKQFDAVTSQFREFQSMTEKLVTETTKPVAAKMEKAMKEMKVA